MLPALLAGAGILAVAALFIFGDSDEAKQADKDGQANAASASANASANAGSQPAAGVRARQVDGADKTARVQPKLNPRIANAIVTEGMAPTPNKPEVPESFPSKDAEIAYWEQELDKATAMLETRQRAQDRIPRKEQEIRETGTPEELADFERRKQIVANNLQRATDRVDEIEEKLVALRG